MTQKLDEHPLQAMRDSRANFTDTRWAVYENRALDSCNCGHQQFLAIGPQNTYKNPPKYFPVGTESGCGWRYLFTGWVNLKTGEI